MEVEGTGRRSSRSSEQSLEAWAGLEDRMATKLAQLMRLLQHFNDVSKHDAQSENSDESPGEHESEIQDILRETASRVKAFKDAMTLEIYECRTQEAVEALAKQHENEKRALQKELDSANSSMELLPVLTAALLLQREKQNEDRLKETHGSLAALNKHMQTLQRKVEELEKELTGKSHELETVSASLKKTIKIERQKIHTEQMLTNSLNKGQNELLIATQNHQLRESEIRDIYEEERISHQKYVEGMLALHREETNRLKVDHSNMVDDCCRTHASIEFGWRHQEQSLQKELLVAGQDKDSHLLETLSMQRKVQELEDLLKSTERSLNNGLLEMGIQAEQARADMEGALESAQSEVKQLRDGLQMAQNERDHLSAALNEVKQEAHISCRWSIVCAATHYSSHEVVALKQLLDSNAKFKVKEAEERQIRMELDLQQQQATAKISQLQMEGNAQGEWESWKYLLFLNPLHASERLKGEEVWSQLEDQKKGGRLQLASMEESLQRQRRDEEEHKTQLHSRHLSVLKEMDAKLQEQENKSLNYALASEKKVEKLQKRIEALENSGAHFEDVFHALSEEVHQHTVQSEQACSALNEELQESHHRYLQLEQYAEHLKEEEAAVLELGEKLGAYKQNSEYEFHNHCHQLSLEHERALQCQKDEITTLKLTLKIERERAKEDLEASKHADANALVARMVEVSEAAKYEIEGLQREHIRQLMEMSEMHHGSLEDSKREWRENLKLETQKMQDSFVQERRQVNEDHLQEVTKLEHKIAALQHENLDKEEKLAELEVCNQRQEKNHMDAQNELRAQHNLLISSMLERQRLDLQTQADVMVMELKMQHQAALEVCKEEVANMKLKMEESQAKMQAKCDKLQVRFENREPRPEDMAQIGALKEAIEKKDAAIKRKQVCDLSNGTWVQDFGAALAYTNDTCKYITGHQNCMTNGRMDTEFLYWRWKPSTCELPQIDARTTLESLRGKSLVFVGDSIARNQFQSLLCILSQAEDPTHLYHDEDWRDHIYVFPSYSFTLSVRWSPYLVRQIEKEIPVMASGGDDDNNSTTTTQVMIAHLDLDLLEETWVQAVVGADIVVISSGQWWSKAGVYLEDGKIVGCHLCSPQLLPELKEEQQQQDPVHEEGAPQGDAGSVRKSIMGFHDAYRRALHNVLEGVLSIPGYKGITMFRSFAPDHFENGSWDSGGSCPRTVPGGVPFDSFTEKMYQIQIEEFHKLVSSHGSLLNESSSSNSSMSSQLGSKEEEDKNGLVAAVVTTSRLKLVDITNLAQIRADGHPNAYRMYQPFAKENVGRIQNDCLHWCLPGPIDVWNDVLMESLQQQQLLEGTKLR
ncbi:unnamed protein product [Sphagnum tenellum]